VGGVLTHTADGYRGTRETEDALQSQRCATIDSLLESLHAYSGEDFGADSERWLAYLQLRDSETEGKWCSQNEPVRHLPRSSYGHLRDS
jgi:hypothetical protein